MANLIVDRKYVKWRQGGANNQSFDAEFNLTKYIKKLIAGVGSSAGGIYDGNGTVPTGVEAILTDTFALGSTNLAANGDVRFQVDTNFKGFGFPAIGMHAHESANVFSTVGISDATGTWTPGISTTDLGTGVNVSVTASATTILANFGNALAENTAMVITDGLIKFVSDVGGAPGFQVGEGGTEWSVPLTRGNNGDILVSDGSGVLTFQAPAGGGGGNGIYDGSDSLTADTTVTQGAFVLDFDATTLTTETALAINATALTTGNGLLVTGGGANMLSGGAVANINMGAATAGSGLEIVSSGVYTTTDGVLNVTANSATTGDVAVFSATGLTTGGIVEIKGNALTTGSGLTISTGSTLTTSGDGLRINMANSVAGNGLFISGTGAYAGGTHGMLKVENNGATTGILSRVKGTGLTSGTVLLLDGGGANMTASGAVAKIDMGAATTGQGLEIITTGVYTNIFGGVLKVTADSATTGNVIDISANALTTSGKALKIDGGNNGGSALFVESGRIIYAGTTAKTGAGAISTTQPIAEWTSSGTAQALTLADGVEGQLLNIIYKAEGAAADSGVLTPTNLGGAETTIPFNDIGDTACLQFSAGAWWQMDKSSAAGTTLTAEGALYFSTPAETSISTVDTPVKVLGTTTLGPTDNFDNDGGTSNRLRYTGVTTRKFRMDAHISVTSASSNKVFSWYFAKNGTIVTESRIQRKQGTSTDVGALGLGWEVELAQNDYVEIWVENNTDDTNVTAEFATFLVD